MRIGPCSSGASGGDARREVSEIDHESHEGHESGNGRGGLDSLGFVRFVVTIPYLGGVSSPRRTVRHPDANRPRVSVRRWCSARSVPRLSSTVSRRMPHRLIVRKPTCTSCQPCVAPSQRGPVGIPRYSPESMGGVRSRWAASPLIVVAGGARSFRLLTPSWPPLIIESGKALGVFGSRPSSRPRSSAPVRWRVVLGDRPLWQPNRSPCESRRNSIRTPSDARSRLGCEGGERFR